MSQDCTKAERFWKHLEPLRGALERYCRHSVRDRSAAEDVLQDAMAAAFRDFDLFAEGTNFRAWIYRYVNLEIRAANRRAVARPHRELVEEPIEEDEWMLAFDETSFAALLGSPDEICRWPKCAG